MNLRSSFSQRIRLEWLEFTAQAVLQGETREAIQAQLQTLLKEQLSAGGSSPRGNREKATTIRLRTWVAGPRWLEPFRNDGLAFLQSMPAADHLTVHWGMVMAAYPFFGSVAETVGRLIRLQSNFTAAQILRRLREQYGERETVQRTAQLVLRCFVDWGVLRDSDEKGVYQAASGYAIRSEKLVLWLIEAVPLSTRVNSMPLADAVRFPSLFPFTLEAINPRALLQMSRLQTFRQALDEEVVPLTQSGHLIRKIGSP